MKIAIIDFGGQYTHLIARRIRNLGIYSEIYHPEDFQISAEICGIIFSGGPQSVNSEDAYKIDFDITKSKVPILGICYGHQLLASILGGEIESGENTEYGATAIQIDAKSHIFNEMKIDQQVWMSHGDHVAILPPSFKITASSESIKIAAFESMDGRFYGFQFHPEVTHSTNGMQMLDKFLKKCTKVRDWDSKHFKADLIAKVREKAMGKKLVLLLSGGVDSMVVLELCIAAVGNENIFSIHVDTGFMRKNESQELKEHFDNLGYQNIKIIKAEKLYLEELKGVVEPEAKRLIIGKLFVDIANNELARIGLKDDWMLVQGTIYPDTIESGDSKKAAKIKTHHNRVEEIEKLIKAGKVIEPLQDLYKDEVRELGTELGLPQFLVQRHPFPGPGLAIRVICSDTTENNDFQKEEEKLNELLSKYDMGGIILPIKSVGVQGDFRTYHHPAVVWFEENNLLSWQVLQEVSTKIINSLKTVNRLVFSLNKIAKPKLDKLFLEKSNLVELQEVDALLRHKTDNLKPIWQMPVVQLPLLNAVGKRDYVIRPVCSQDAMSADFYEMDFDYLKKIMTITQELPNVGDIFYDITTKPPGTIEWE
ncbi:MAG: glutamine-hydrolyzing GMP synthase [Candidatus Cloacimonetes bacterium]|jgi:GMP synthase (glutamine-hydrolysing)|nr:glutamine-hydrolyzing GMP synthase [Candidatus Cloacimonadota bacterium]MBT6993778.1 glutamine-hydrolyzing GMP synthase [Candidatus Cloacimonadota bacterium]